MHVKKLLLFGLILALLAPFALATIPPNEVVCPVCVDDLVITNYFSVDCDACCLTFPDAAAVAQNKGTYYTDTCIISAQANKNITMVISLPNKLTASVGTPPVIYTLPTDITYRYQQDALAWSAWVTGWAPYSKTINFNHATHKGSVRLQLKLSVKRSGLADHFGTYSTSATVTVSGC